MTTVYRAAQGLLTEGGYFALRLKYVPLYAHDGVASIHTLLELGDACRVYYDGADHRVHLEVDDVAAEHLTSDALTFASGATLTIDVEHTDDRRRVRVRGAASGNSRIDADPRPASVIESMIYVLGTKQGGAEEASTLVSLGPIQADTFAEVADEGLPTQNDPDGAIRKFVRVLATRRGRIHDVSLLIRDAMDVEHTEGEALDVIGSIVGLPRHGFPDDRYRTFLGIQVELLLAQAREDGQWTGTSENILRIARRFIGSGVADPVVLTNAPPYDYQLDVPGLDLAEADYLVRFLRIATYAAVRGIELAILGSNSLWDSVEEDVDDGWIWDSVEEDVPNAAVWAAVVST